LERHDQVRHREPRIERQLRGVNEEGSRDCGIGERRGHISEANAGRHVERILVGPIQCRTEL